MKFDNVLLLVTDAAPYMKTSSERLSVSHPKLTHVMRVAYDLQRVCTLSNTKAAP
jgi:hypothetical protein